jgi:DNA-binding beta-propeller fold protein YncE
VLDIEGKKVRKSGDVMVGGIPEGAVFSPDGHWLYVGNYVDRNVSVLRVEGDRIVDTGVAMPLPGSPASMRGRVQ